MLKLPIGIQDFREMRSNDYMYVDKTRFLYRLITEGKYYFLSRPRRFGKSLLISTLDAIFSGEQDLFKGLWIEDKIEWQKHPVIRIDFTKSGYQEMGLRAAIDRMLIRHAEGFGIELSEHSLRERFNELVSKAHEKTDMQVVVLIDEYDKPIIDNMENLPIAEENRDILKDFYGVLKPLDPHLKFVFLTGVTKFSKVAIFYDLNNLYDITTSRHYSTMLGLTKDEIDATFADRIPDVLKDRSCTRKEFDRKLKYWYDGYSWDARNFVYNPFSILRFFSEFEFANYWFSTGTPTFLVKFIREQGIDITDFEDFPVTGTFFDKFDIASIDIVSLMFQTGYLTIKGKNKYGFTILSYPNHEVRISFSENLLEAFSHRQQSELGWIGLEMLRSLEENDMDTFKFGINSLFASIPNQIFIRHKEAYYHSIIYLILKLLGVHIDVEVSTARGRIDAVIKTKDLIYIMEFKMLPDKADDALAQIAEKGYAEPYKSDSRKKLLIGISFDPEKQQIGEMKMQEQG